MAAGKMKSFKQNSLNTFLLLSDSFSRSFTHIGLLGGFVIVDHSPQEKMLLKTLHQVTLQMYDEMSSYLKIMDWFLQLYMIFNELFLQLY